MPTRRNTTAAVALTAVAGYIDAICYLALFRVYTANMSGNSIALGMDAARGDLRDAARRALPIASFFAGLMLAGLAIELARLRGVRRRVSLALGIEVLALLAFLWVASGFPAASWHTDRPIGAAGAVLVTLAAVAMGAQNASLRDAGALDIYTTHVTGTLTAFSRDAVRYLMALRDRDGNRDPSGEASAAHLVFLGSLWLLYVGGAAAGGVGWRTAGLQTVLLAVAAVLCVAAMDLLHPLAPR
jgi:uncharacterized membrane protein YoaK (UPF0700 family)